MKLHTKRWFRNRIGETIYRKPINPNCCEICAGTDVYIVRPIEGDLFFHADYLYNCQFGGIEYYGTKKELKKEMEAATGSRMAAPG